MKNNNVVAELLNLFNGLSETEKQIVLKRILCDDKYAIYLTIKKND